MDELQVVEKLGIAKSSTIHTFINRGIGNLIKTLNQMERYGEIKIVILHYHRGTKKLYMKNEIYQNYFN